MTNKENIQSFLDSEPRLLREHNRSKYIPILVVKEDLNLLCDGDWNTSDLKAREYEISDYKFISGSLILYVNYGEKRRFFVGSATIQITGSNNAHHEATLQSECIKNAAKNLGRRFGMYLNEEGKDMFDDFEDEIITVETKTIKNSIPFPNATNK